MSEIQQLSPNLLWKWFDQICAIPHPSYQENELAEFIVNWAKGKGFYAARDEVGNVLIRKPATKGMENRKKGGFYSELMDSAAGGAGRGNRPHTDPILPYIDGEWIHATNTTLGADNGIGMASTLAILDSKDIAHPDLEVLLTMTEERGMEGAIGLRPNWLQSEIMINTDTEENGEIYVGCAGGENANITLPVGYQNNLFSHSYQIILKGLRGGHSGCDIHTGRANAIKVLARFLAKLTQNQPHFDFLLSDIRGGSIRNAIPREAFAMLNFNGDVTQLKSVVENFGILLKTELALVEPNLTFDLQPINKPEKTFTASTTQSVINLLNVLPNGVIRNSDVLENTVETSLSVGVLKTEENQIKATILVRSLIDSGKEYVTEMLQSLASLSGACAEFSGSYPGWEPQAHSPIVDLTHKIYADILGYEPTIKVIHAGLECGLLKKIYPNMDMVSIGPTIKNAHSPDEKVHIPAVQIYWSLITKLLAEIPAK